MNKPKEILELEQVYSIKLTPLKRNINIMDSKNTFWEDKFEEIVGLNLSGNRICDISHLAQFKKLHSLNIADNEVHDILPLKELII